MVTPETGENKHDAIELILARLLRIGSVIAALLLATGIALLTVEHSGFAHRLITAGLLVLLGTPVARVLAAALIFVRERDWHFAFFCLVVLVALGIGVFLGSTE